MKKLLVLFLLVVCGVCRGQNLVPNPSFEYHISCGGDSIAYGIMDGYFTPWDNPTDATPDGYNSCSLASPNFLTPNGYVGYQIPHTGNGYIGAISYYSGTVNYREYIQVKLDSALKNQEWYCVSFYVSLADFMGLATNNFGMYFSNTHTYISTTGRLNLVPQINATNIISDTAHWTLVYGQYQAVGGENYIIIGNFYSDTLTDTVQFNPLASNSNDSYYYFDDVNVHCCSCDSIDHTGVNELGIKSNKIEIYPNPITDRFTINIDTHEPTEITLYDLSSRKLLQQTFINTTTINTEQLAKGMYMYEVRNKNGVIKNGKVIKE